MRKNQKKAVSSSVFFYVLIALVAVAVLVIAFRAIQEAGKSAAQSRTATTMQAIKSDVSSLAVHQGKVSGYHYSLPEGSTMLCFVDANHKAAISRSPSFAEISPYMADALQTDYNAFFLGKKGEILASFKADGLKIAHYPYYECYSDKRFTLKLRSIDNYAYIDIRHTVSEQADCTLGSDLVLESPYGISITIPAGTTIIPQSGECTDEIELSVSTNSPSQLPVFAAIGFNTEIFSLSPSIEFSTPALVRMRYYHDNSEWPVVTLTSPDFGESSYYFVGDPSMPADWPAGLTYSYDSGNEYIEFRVSHFSHIFAGTSEIRDIYFDYAGTPVDDSNLLLEKTAGGSTVIAVSLELFKDLIPSQFSSTDLSMICVNGENCDGDLYILQGENWDEDNLIVYSKITELLASDAVPVASSCEVCTDEACPVVDVVDEDVDEDADSDDEDSEAESWLKCTWDVTSQIRGIIDSQFPEDEDAEVVDDIEILEGETDPFAGIPDHGFRPVNLNANQKTIAVLNFLYDLPGRTENKMIAGQFLSDDYNIAYHWIDAVHDETGQWLGLAGTDYIHGDANGYSNANPILVEHWNNGGLVTISSHFDNPVGGGNCFEDHTEVDFTALTTEGTQANTAWKQQMDLVAEGLQELEDAGVVVIYRPFHEMNGDWFWWGDKNPDQFKEAWRYMFDYLTDEKGLDNLLWFYCPDDSSDPIQRYPGDEYADIVGLDAYTSSIEPGQIRGYDSLVALGKPFAFGEFGPGDPTDAVASIPCDDVGDGVNGVCHFDYADLIEGIKAHFPDTVFVQSWGIFWSVKWNENAEGYLTDPWVITRDEIPDWSGTADAPAEPEEPEDTEDETPPAQTGNSVNITFVIVPKQDAAEMSSLFHDSETGSTATGPVFRILGIDSNRPGHGYSGEAVDALSIPTCEAEGYDRGAAPTVSDSGGAYLITFENGYQAVWNKGQHCGITQVKSHDGVILRQGEGRLEIKKLRTAQNGIVREGTMNIPWCSDSFNYRVEGNSVVIEYKLLVHPDEMPTYGVDSINVETKLTPYTKDIAGTEFKGIGEKHTIIETPLTINEAHVYTQYYGEGMNTYDLWFTYFHSAGDWNHLHGFPLLMTQEGIAFMYQNFDYDNPGRPTFGNGHRVCYPSVFKYPSWMQVKSFDDTPRHFNYEMRSILGMQTGTIELPEVICIQAKSEEMHETMWFKINQYFYDYYHKCYGLASAMPESMYDADVSAEKTKTNAELLNVDAIMIPQSNLWCGDQMELCNPVDVENLAQWAHDNGKKIYIWFNPVGLDVVWRNNEVKYLEWNIMGEPGNVPTGYLGLMTGWYDFSIEKLVALSRGVKGDTGIDGIFLDSAANMGGESIDYNTGMPNLPYMISWISELNSNGLLVLTEQPTPYGNFGGMRSGTLNGNTPNEFYGAYGLSVGDPGNNILNPDGSDNDGCLIELGDTPHPPQGRTKYMGPTRVGICLSSDPMDVVAIQIERPGLIREPDTVFLPRENAAYARLRAAVHDARPSYLVPEGSGVRWVYNNVEALDGTIINGEIVWDSSDSLQFIGISESG